MSKSELKTKYETSKVNNENKLDNLDFSQIPTSDEFQKIKVKPPKRWFNSLMAIEVATIGICLGVLIGYLIICFA